MMENLKEKENISQIVDKQFDLIISQDTDLQHTQKLVADAQSNAQKAKDKIVRWYSSSTPTIECLQDSAISQANALNYLCQNQIDIYEKMQKLSVSMRELFLLGVINSSYTTAIIELLRKKTNYANLTETAKQQVLGIIRSLEHHADIQNRIDRLKTKVANLNVNVKQLEVRFDLQLSEIEKELHAIKSIVESQNNIIQSLEEIKIANDLIIKLKSLKDSFENKIVYANSQERRIKLCCIIAISSIVVAITSIFLAVL